MMFCGKYSKGSLAMSVGRLLSAVVAAVMLLAACSEKGLDTENVPRKFKNRTDAPRSRKVLLLYSAGLVDISNYLKEDIQDLENGYVPRKMESADVLLVFSRQPIDHSCTKRSPSYLYRLSTDVDDNLVRDTLAVWPADSAAASAGTMKAVLTYVRDKFPSSSYGMIFSSHATGWLPAEITASPSSSGSVSLFSVGADMSGSKVTDSMELEDFAAALPMKLDYLIFDACLMGGVEAAYALRNKCNNVVFAQTETMADGLCDYKTLTQNLLKPNVPDLKGMCEVAYEHYMSLTGINKAYTVSIIDCSRLEPLAGISRELFDRYRTQIANVNPSRVQACYHTYFLSSARRHYFYDMDDILYQSGVSQQDMSRFRTALEGCVVYKAATPKFLTLTIDKHCGLSMYLPSNGTNALDEFYKTLSWNKATELVK